MSASLRLEVVGGGPSSPLPEDGRLIVGSDGARANLVLEGQGIAAVHCAIGRLKGGGWALKDLGSEYGTIVNGARVASARLEHGDVITLGSRRLRVIDPERGRSEGPVDRGSPESSARTAAPAPREGLGVSAGGAPAERAIRPANGAGSALTIRGYRIERVLGRGGMGQVFLATQESLARKVALKVLAAELEADEAFVERFQAEARTAAALAHTNVVTVHDVGECDGHHYLSMEFMAAGCLESRLQALGPIPWREALGILVDAARGLEYAESRGIVHGDVKPANLMQTEHGATKICDLGLAVQVEREEVTAEGRKLFGTPHFLAPELVRGGRPDARSDLYALGATAYRILSGHTPHEGDSTREILRRVLNDEPEPLGEAVPGLPEGVSHMVARLLAKDPGERYASAAVLVAELERLQSAGGALPAPRRRRRRSRARPLVVGIGTLVLIGLGLKVMIQGGGAAPDPGPGPGSGGTGSVAIVPENVEDTNTVGVPITEGGGDTRLEPADDDTDEKLFETQARLARFELNDETMPEEQRVAKLRALSQKFLGTDAGRQALEDAEALETRLTEETRVETARARERSAMLAALRAAVSSVGDPSDGGPPNTEPSDTEPSDTEPSNTGPSDPGPPRPGESLRALRAVPGQEVWETDAEFVAARTALRDQILDGARDWAEAAWVRGAQFEEVGNFAGLLEICLELDAVADLPDFSEGDPPQALRLLELADDARAKRAVMSALEASYHSRHAQQERATLAGGLGGVHGLEAELRSLDFAGARERLERTRDSLSSQTSRERIEPLLLVLQRAQGALRALAETWDAGEWKRQSVRDPRTSRTRSAVGVDSRGLLLEAGGTAEHVPWSAWGGNLRGLDNIYNARLRRDWNVEESRDIAALMYLTAVVQTAELAAQMLDPDREARFLESEAEELVEILEDARKWALRAGDDSAVRLELAAAAPLIRALRAATVSGWSDAVSALERLLGEHDRSLLVLLLSDGSVWRLVPPEPEPETDPDGEPDPGSDPESDSASDPDPGSRETRGADDSAAESETGDDPPVGGR